MTTPRARSIRLLLYVLGVLVTIGASSAACDRDESRSSLKIRLFEPASRLPQLRILVRRVDGGDERTIGEFSLADFSPGPDGRPETGSLTLPGGRIALRVTLRDDAGSLADGTLQLEIRERQSWVIDVFRQTGDPLEGCIGCTDSRSIEIPAERQEVPGERIWIVWTIQPAGGGGVIF